MSGKQPLNWPALIVLGVVVVLGAIGILAILTPIPPSSHDIVLSIVSGFIGALTLKGAERAISAIGGPDQPAPPAPAELGGGGDGSGA